MKRVFILFMAFVSGIAFLNQISNVAQAADFKIGVLYPFSGTLAKFGEENYIGLEFARDIINERGGVLGSKITYVKGDANSTTAAVAEAERLITQEKIKVIMGTYSSTLSAAASEVAERNRVIYWEIIGVGDALTDRGFQYYFRLNSKGSELGTGAVEYLVEEAAPKIKVKAKDLKAAVIYEDGLFGKTCGPAAKKKLEEIGIMPVLVESYSAKSLDLSSLILKIKALTPDAVIATSYLTDAILFQRQSKELGLNIKVFIGTGGGYDMNELADALGNEANYIIDVDPLGVFVPMILDPKQKALQEFKKRFMAKYGKYNPSPQTTTAYLAAMAFFEYVLPKAGSFDPEAIRKAALEIDIAKGTLLPGFGFKFAAPGHPSAGHNLKATVGIAQWQKKRLIPIFPKDLALADVKLPMPTFGQRTME